METTTQYSAAPRRDLHGLVVIIYGDRLERELIEQAVLTAGCRARAFASFAQWSGSDCPRPTAVVAEGRLLESSEGAGCIPGLLAASIKLIAIDIKKPIPGVFSISRSSGLNPLLKELESAGIRQVRERHIYHLSVLTNRERLVAELIAAGLTNQAIADRTGLKLQSVKNSVSAVMKKLGCRTRVQIALQLTEGDRD